MTRLAIIVTGSRHQLNERAQELVVRQVGPALERGGVLFVGDARGVDAHVYDLSRKSFPEIVIRRFDADWRRYGNAAGPRRNEAMAEAFGAFLEANPDYDYRAFAFPCLRSRGTYDCLRRLANRRLHVDVWGLG